MTHQHFLDVQRLDTEAEQLRHKHQRLPQRAALDAARAERQTVIAEIDAIGISRVEVATRQKRFEDEALVFADKADEDDKRLYGGDVGVKDLQSLQDEIAGLRARQGELEDRAIEAMEEGEALAERLATTERRLEEVDATIVATEAELAEAEADLDGELTRVAAERDAARNEVDPADLANYERLRPGLGIATVVKLEGGNCVGCPSTMPAVELDRMKHEPSGSILDCSECGRIVLT